MTLREYVTMVLEDPMCPEHEQYLAAGVTVLRRKSYDYEENCFWHWLANRQIVRMYWPSGDREIDRECGPIQDEYLDAEIDGDIVICPIDNSFLITIKR